MELRLRGGPVLLLAAWLLASSALGETVSAAVIEATGVPVDAQQRIVRIGEVALKELSSLKVKELAPKTRPLGKKGCSVEAACLSNTAAAIGADHALLLALTRQGERLFVDAFFVDVKARKALRRQIPEGRFDEPEASIKAVVEAVLPPFARKGWGGLTLKPEPGTKIKIDGERYALSGKEPFLPLTAGWHQVDVLYPSGAALLQKHLVREGERESLPIPSEAMLPTGVEASSHSDALLATSYTVFAVGALTVASSFIVAAMARNTARDLTPCVAGQACTSFEEAMAQQRRGQNLARNANVLLGVGGGLCAVGTGLFVFDLVRTPRATSRTDKDAR